VVAAGRAAVGGRAAADVDPAAVAGGTAATRTGRPSR
jgi:hypothetical protein